MGHGGLHGWTWEGVASVTLQETVTNAEFLGNRVQENSLCGSVSMKPRGFNSVVPDTAKPTTLDLCRTECASAWLVQKMQSDRLSWVWIWMRPCGKSGFLYKVLSLSMLLCRTQPGTGSGPSWLWRRKRCISGVWGWRQDTLGKGAFAFWVRTLSSWRAP